MSGVCECDGSGDSGWCVRPYEGSLGADGEWYVEVRVCITGVTAEWRLVESGLCEGLLGWVIEGRL